jgi:hypothetical protein
MTAAEFIKVIHPQDYDDIPQWHIDELEAYAALQNKPQPTAEGAEHDIEAMRKCLHYYVNLIEINHYDALIFGAMRDYADEFATLHAQKIADKKYADTEADGYVFCGKCGKMKEI